MHRTRQPSAKAQRAHFHRKLGDPSLVQSRVYHDRTPSMVAAIPEYAPMGGVLIAYPGVVAPPTDRPQAPPSGPRSFGIPDELIVRMQQNDTAEPVHVFVMCQDITKRDEICAALHATAVARGLTFNPDHLHLVPWDTDTFWTRDFGPWWVHNQKTDTYAIAKHTYTTLGGGAVGLVEGAETVPPTEGLGIFRPNDDYGAVKLSDFLNAPIRDWNAARWGSRQQKKLPPIPTHDFFYLGLLEVGGNYMITGKGEVASSYLVATQNELPEAREGELTSPDQAVVDARMRYILGQMNRFMGLHTYHVLADPTGTYIGHIDCWGKFLADDKVLIARSEDPTIDAHFDGIAASFEERGFKVYRVLCQDLYLAAPPLAAAPTAGVSTTAAYTNSLLLNGCAYVPLAGAGHEERDADALRVYREALPDHEVIGIVGKPEFPWLGTDAMHCRTRGIPRQVVRDWLRSQQPA